MLLKNAKKNFVSDRVSVGGLLGTAPLQGLLPEGKRILLFLDCEGCEAELLDLSLAPTLSHTDFIVECHNFALPNMASILEQRFHATHQIRRITEGARNPNQSKYLRHRTSIARWLAVEERRPETMEWLHATSLRRAVS
jgi:hypothetical protein